eukprot:4738-Heterococcus_DN1.PRE.1
MRQTQKCVQEVLQTGENVSVQAYMLMQEQIDESSKTWHILLAGDDSVLSSALPSSRQLFDLPRVVCATNCKARDEPLGKISAVTATQTGPLQAAEQPDVYNLSSPTLSLAGDIVLAEGAMSALEAPSLLSRFEETLLRDDNHKRELRSSLRSTAACIVTAAASEHKAAISSVSRARGRTDRKALSYGPVHSCSNT